MTETATAPMTPTRPLLSYRQFCDEYTATFRDTRPLLTVELTRSTSTQRGLHQGWYVVTSKQKLERATLSAMAKAGIFGFGQDIRDQQIDDLVVTTPCVAVNRKTGKAEPDVVVVDHRGQQYDRTIDQTYYRYEIHRTTDSGD
jgi:hypothetical protein